MGWACGFDPTWQRDIGYGVPATCDQPGCGAPIDRGLSYVCGGQPYGGDEGCGLYFCTAHLAYWWDEDDKELAENALCDRCRSTDDQDPYPPTPDVAEWVRWKLTDESWRTWREQYPGTVAALTASVPTP